MTTFLVGSTKGGVGKSTLASNLAVYLAHENFDVVLLDCDPQATSKRWVDRRGERNDGLPVVHVAQASGDCFKIARDLASRYEHVVIDVGGRGDSRELRTAMCAADILITPTKASQPDLECFDALTQVVSLAKGLNPGLRAYSVLSMAPSNPLIRDEVAEAKSFLGDFPELDLLPVIVRDRKVYRDAILAGLSVVELANSQAKAEIQLLGQALLELEMEVV